MNTDNSTKLRNQVMKAPLLTLTSTMLSTSSLNHLEKGAKAPKIRNYSPFLLLQEKGGGGIE